MGAGGKPGVGVASRQQQVVVARSFAQDAGGQKNTPRFLDQNAGAEIRNCIHAQLEPKDEQSASVVGQVVRGVVFA